jgi:hypothetical protein
MLNSSILNLNNFRPAVLALSRRVFTHTHTHTHTHVHTYTHTYIHTYIRIDRQMAFQVYIVYSFRIEGTRKHVNPSIRNTVVKVVDDF